MEKDDRLRGLSSLEYKVTQEGFTEAPFSHPYNDLFQEGIYVDIVSGEALFSSRDKFHSACGWPSFSRPLEEENLSYREDRSLAVLRTEVLSRKGASHLGHVFKDGPRDLGGLRYCINGSSLRFIERDRLVEEGYGQYLDIFKEDL